MYLLFMSISHLLDYRAHFGHIVLGEILKFGVRGEEILDQRHCFLFVVLQSGMELVEDALGFIVLRIVGVLIDVLLKDIDCSRSCDALIA